MNNGSFVLGHQIIYNFIICQELIHTLKHKLGRKGDIINKMDFEKVYDQMKSRLMREKDIRLPIRMIET